MMTKRFGFDWLVTSNEFYQGRFGEIQFETDSIDGTYFVIVVEDGEIGAWELSGGLMNPYDREVGDGPFSSVLEAMQACRKDYNKWDAEYRRQEEVWLKETSEW